MCEDCQDSKNCTILRLVKSALMPVKITQEVYLEEYGEEEMDPQSLDLMQRARAACAQAYAPYSQFRVGCALLLENGAIIVGNNQENASYPNGLCAERVALFAASSSYPKMPILKLAVSAQKSDGTPVEVTPCGGCRQSMMEYQSLQSIPIQVLMEGDSGKINVVPSIDVLLPFKFSSDSLK